MTSLAPGDVLISEIHYNPQGDDDSEFIELWNPTTHAVNLRGAKFIAGIDYVFPDNRDPVRSDYILTVESRDPLLRVPCASAARLRQTCFKPPNPRGQNLELILSHPCRLHRCASRHFRKNARWIRGLESVDAQQGEKWDEDVLII